MATVIEITDGKSLQPFLDMAKPLKDTKSIAGIIRQALSAPNVFVFGELLSLDCVQQLEKGDEEAQQHYELLKIFAYGTYSDYKSRESKLPKLTKQQLTKLKQLTIVALASENRIIPYKTLQEKLEITNVRELEDLVIDCIYQGILIGRLDQQKAQLQVSSAIGRDLRPGQIDELLRTLNLWAQQSEILMKTIDEKINWAKNAHESYKKQKQQFEKHIEELKQTIKTALDTESMTDAQFEESDILEEGRARKRGGKHPKAPKPARNFM
jgi:COP9 signalosome complex subunit 7